ncbi:MAG: hypothetical protein U0R44_00600 [Candidatus Micrarchaeia archaeon]
MARPKKKPEETAPPAAEHEETIDSLEQEPKAGKSPGGSGIKTAAVVLLAIVFIALAYYFLTSSESRFVPSSEVDAETFKGIFANATKVFIVMDVRGASSDKARTSILQCGVDFASSSGMGGKTVTPISFGNDGCVAPDGKKDDKQCFAMLKDGITVYVVQGTSGTRYYSNGMVVTVSEDYAVGTCGIKRTL